MGKQSDGWSGRQARVETVKVIAVWSIFGIVMIALMAFGITREIQIWSN